MSSRYTIGSRTTRIVAAAMAAAAVVIAALAFTHSFAQASGESKTVTVPGNQEWTDTGISLTEGQALQIKASGTVGVCGPECAASPVGTPFSGKLGAGRDCGEIAYDAASEVGKQFIVPGVNCFAMVFKVGSSGVPFPVGKKLKTTAPVSGELFLGVNDQAGEFGNNSGSWSATVKVG
jgi:hypothetical protein